jgi:hypothetical protein
MIVVRIGNVVFAVLAAAAVWFAARRIAAAENSDKSE